MGSAPSKSVKTQPESEQKGKDLDLNMIMGRIMPIKIDFPVKAQMVIKDGRK